MNEQHIKELITEIRIMHEVGADSGVYTHQELVEMIEWLEQQPAKIPGAKFLVGDKVYKPKGYEFPGTVLSVFLNGKAEVRMAAQDDRGMIHIFNEGQLELVGEDDAC